MIGTIKVARRPDHHGYAAWKEATAGLNLHVLVMLNIFRFS